MGIVSLTGFMGSGKSSVGVRLASRLGWTFVDLDRYLERRCGRSIPDIFREDGEEGFRRLELESLRALLAEQGDDAQLVLSLGGGTVTREEARNLVRTHTQCVFLRTRPETLRERLARSWRKRPLLNTDTMESLLESRLKDYMETASLVFDTDGLTPDEIAQRLYLHFKP